MQLYDRLLQILGYLIAGTFLLTISDSLQLNLTFPAIVTFNVFGWGFLIFAFVLLIALAGNFLFPQIAWVNRILVAGLSSVVLADLIKRWVEETPEHIILFRYIGIFIVLLPLAIISNLVLRARQQTISEHRGLRRDTLARRLLRAIAIVFGLFGAILALMGVSDFGNPVFYVAIGLVVLSIESSL